MPNTLKGTEVSLSYGQCFLYLVSFSINVSVFSYHMAGYLLGIHTGGMPPGYRPPYICPPVTSCGVKMEIEKLRDSGW